MRFCKGDGPSLEFECGNQRGGYFYCPGCKIHASRTYELDHAFRCPHITLQEHQQAVLKGRIGLRRSLDLHPKPLANLRKEDLKTEVIGRGLEVDGDKKEDYQKALTIELAGQCRVPALLYHEPSTPLEDLGLSKYEILSCEPIARPLQPHHKPFRRAAKPCYRGHSLCFTRMQRPHFRSKRKEESL